MAENLAPVRWVAQTDLIGDRLAGFTVWNTETRKPHIIDTWEELCELCGDGGAWWNIVDAIEAWARLHDHWGACEQRVIRFWCPELCEYRETRMPKPPLNWRRPE